MFVILIVICAYVPSSLGWTELLLDDGLYTKQSGYIDFDPTTTRIQMRLTQLLPDNNLQLRMEYEFFEEAKRDTIVSSLTFDWRTKSGYQSKVFLHVGPTFSDCDAAKPEMLMIPSFASIDLNKDYIVEMDGTLQGSFKGGCEATDDGSDAWEIWKSEAVKIGKLNVKLTDGKFYTPDCTTRLQDYFMVEYRLVQGCPAGQYISKRAESCTNCTANTYSTGGLVDSCTDCPAGKTVVAGLGTHERNCTCWGEVLDDSDSGARKNITTGALVQASIILLFWFARGDWLFIIM